MNLFDQIYKDMIDAKKARDTFKSEALSFIYAAIKQYQIDARKQKDVLADEEVVTVLNKAVKQRKDSIEMYVSGGRTELADKEKKELEILFSYLPKQMTENEIFEFIKNEAAALGITSAKDMPKLMGGVMPKLKGKADGKLANEMAKKVMAAITSAAPQA